MNIVALKGVLARPAETRELPSGTRLATYQLTIVRPDEPADTVPVVWFDPPASAGTLDTGAEVVVVGRVRRRFFQAGGRTASSTEVVAEAVVPSRHAKRARSMLDRAREALWGGEAGGG